MKVYIGKICYDQTALQPHAHKEHELFLYLSGSGELRTSEETFPIQAGNLAVVPPGIRHHHVPDCALEGICIRGAQHQMLLPSAPAVISDNEKHDGSALVQMIYHNRFENGEYIQALCSALTHFVLQRLKTEDGVAQAVKRLVHQMGEQFCDSTIDLCALLQQSGYAEDYIRAQFKRVTGNTPTEFLTQLRIRHACFLIDTYRRAVPLSEVAARCGYVDYVFFSRRFKQIMGLSPRAYLSTCL